MSARSRSASAFGIVMVACALAAGAALAASPVEYDDCDANFIAFIGADAYQFSPFLPGELGQVRLFSVLSYQRAAALGRWGAAAWRLEVRGPDGANTLVRTAQGVARIDGRGRALAEFVWDGRDAAGRLAPEGRYRYTFVARFVADRVRTRLGLDYDGLKHVPGVEEAYASTDEVIVNFALDEPAATEIRVSALATACQVQQNTPLEPGFGYNFYYGSTHSHSNYTDGGQPTTNCSSGNAYGSGSFDPAAVYSFARNNAGLDYWVVNDHNHLFNDGVATNDPPLTEAKVRQRYQTGRNAAIAATTDGTFVGLYGMEWGVTTNSDQGHVTILETPVLFGWETCTGCNGPNPECTPGSDCYFDVFTPKRYGYLTLYQRSVENPSAAGPLGIFCHPGSSNFDNFAFDANADAALQGIAVRSGLAFSTATDCADANVGATDYSQYWRLALDRGFHVGPTADHDAHCNNFGVALPNRTVYLLPNGATPALTRTAMLEAHKARHFFATEDPNAQLVFATSDGAHIMGDIFTAGASVTLRAAAYDPAGEALASLELWRGQIGAGALTAPYRSWTNVDSFTVTEAPPAGAYYYFVHAVQADGHDLWSAPMWITLGGSCTDTTVPSVTIAAPAAGATIACTDTAVQVSASDAGGIASAEVRIDGGAWQPAAYNAGSGFYEYAWASSAASSGSHTIEARATDASCGANVGTAAPVTVTVNSSGCGGGSGLDISGWTLTQANATYTYTLPAGTVIPPGGYVIVARDAAKAAFETFWGITLAADVVFVNATGAMPVINGSETYTLYNATGGLVEGPTIAMSSGAGQSVRRNDPCQAAGSAASWTAGATTTANPGAGAGAGCGIGVVINEFADASGTGNFVYEFVELHYDAPAAGDGEAPLTAITAPAAGATVSGATTVTASASDNVGVTSVEFYLDGALAATDATSPYSWSWDTRASANGAHTLSAKAYDAAGNVGISSAVGIIVNNVVGTDVSNYRIVQANSTLTYTIPSGTVIPNNGYLVIGRQASQAAFEAFWGVTLGTGAVYVNANGALPQINGSENFTLYDAAGTKLDGRTISMSAAGGQSIRRKDPCQAAGKTSSWTVGADTTANPGSGAGTGCAKGIVINEFSDASGANNYVYEFVELHNDR